MKKIKIERNYFFFLRDKKNRKNLFRRDEKIIEQQLHVSYRWPLKQLDVNKAFCNDFLEEEVYMQQPQNLKIIELSIVCSFLKALYSLIRVSRKWFEYTSLSHTHKQTHLFSLVSKSTSEILFLSNNHQHQVLYLFSMLNLYPQILF